MGWSGGGCSALLAALKQPDIVQKLVLWGTFAYVYEEDAQIFNSNLLLYSKLILGLL